MRDKELRIGKEIRIQIPKDMSEVVIKEIIDAVERVTNKAPLTLPEVSLSMWPSNEGRHILAKFSLPNKKGDSIYPEYALTSSAVDVVTKILDKSVNLDSYYFHDIQPDTHAKNTEWLDIHFKDFINIMEATYYTDKILKALAYETYSIQIIKEAPHE